jgi:hypothetical protein
LDCRSIDKKKRLLYNVKYASMNRVAASLEITEERAGKVFLRFMQASSLIEELRAKLAEFPKKVTWIQRRIRSY